ncbi:vacuolar ATPase assembly integral membrane protein VMA21-like [Crassostrea angulata]|uniref:Vacuolar ATPase assembly integral membrane protein VMA21 homolog n=1 Tax=Magallana gigas TaxID=29159 RepID=A0A8W8KZ97_MAGGI|nr:vacuolar ATPase assembly integral membrane protein VMA21-like [Crassostrea gigas]XP_052672921.1 vacuolar ATPase assembly integral membrane protein VMA21-like [Crassostrea angulata]|eukprot:XP_011412573.1 PREDICTED: vacuolar ATPase assembly integral membrane protein VMA21-like [Crassostrea gigas]
MADDLRSRIMKDEAHTNSVMKTMILFSLAMIFFPVFLYFFSKAVIFEGTMGISSQDSSFYSAFVAIGAVHIILGLFLYAAFTEDTSKPTDLKAE